MYKVSAIVHGSSLQSIITALHKETDEVSIQRLGTSQSISGRTIKSDLAAEAGQPKKRGRPRGVQSGTKRGPYATGGNMMKLAREQLAKLGTGPFQLSQLMGLTRPAGIRDTAVYQMLRQEGLEGNVKKLGPGQYQRTGKGLAAHLGLEHAHAASNE